MIILSPSQKNHLQEVEGELGSVAPELLETIEVAGLGGEDVDDDRAVVHEHPGLLLAALDGKRVLAASLGDLLLDLINDRRNILSKS